VAVLARELHDIAVVTKLNVDENPELTARLSVMHLPTLIVLMGGKEIGRKSGIIPLPKLKETLTSFGLKDLAESAL
jgi:thioredoxin 1